jgi:hypothetical protein
VRILGKSCTNSPLKMNNIQDGIFLYQTKKSLKLDKQGNSLYLRYFESPDQTSIYVLLNLKLASENRIRSLGYVDCINGVFYCTRQSSKHYHHKTKSYAFNWGIICEPDFNIRHISLDIDHESRYTFPITLLNQHGKFLNFAKQGFELQRFLPLDIIKKYQTNDKITIRLNS